MPDIANMHAWIDIVGDWYGRFGYALVLLGALGENTALLGLVLPGGTLALLGAFYARQGTLNLGWVILFAWLGTVLGYHIDYLIGRYALGGVVGRVSDTRLGARLRLAGRLRQARRLLNRHGGKAILLSHTVGHIRSFVALSAGATRMSYRRFLAFELVAALLWNIGYGLLGYFLGTQRERLQMVIERAGWGVVAALLALFLCWRFVRPRARGWLAWLAPAVEWFRANTFMPAWLARRGCRPVVGYALAALLPLAAVALDALLVRGISAAVPMGLLEMLAVVLVALSWGAGPSTLATLIGAVMLNVVVQPPLGEIKLDTHGDAVGIALFLFVGGVVSVFASQTERARRAASEANQRMDECISIVSHELRQPLTSIKGAVQLTGMRVESLLCSASARAEGPDTAMVRKLESVRCTLDDTEHEVDLLNRLIDDLLAAARAQTRRLDLHPTRNDLVDIVRHAVQVQRLAWPTRVITLETPDAELPVVADAERVQQVVTNYLTNALKYSPERRPVAVTVACERDGTGASVRVRDEGAGLPPAEQGRIWQRFHRAPGIRVQSGGGTSLGLGLHISKTIIEQHGGSVGVTSAPGHGSTFTFTLPLAERRETLDPAVVEPEGETMIRDDTTIVL